jgi:nitroimidazol reductase NimA-like FMN-containing flavoprotein (pyridoxamine 5'-phosphate oxidase superfamily)
VTEAERELQTIDADECWELLRQSTVGRLAVALPSEGPHVVPVNYAVFDEMIVFRTDPGTKVHLLRQFPVSFEVDQVDTFHRTGWSVVVKGVAHELDAEETAEYQLERWVGGGAHWLGVRADAITGRRIALLPGPSSQPGYL